MVTLAVASILVGLAIPSFSDMIRKSQLTTQINEFVTAVNLARSESVKRGITVIVEAKSGTNWEQGWTVKLPAPCATDCVLRDYPALKTGFTLRGNMGNMLDYKSDGTLQKTGYLVLCKDNKVQDGYIKLLNINFIGRLQVAKDTTGNGLPEYANKTEVSSCT